VSTIAGYQISGLIYESTVSTICRAVRSSDNKPVVLKILKKNYPSPEEIVNYKQEYRITRSLEKCSGVIRAHELETHQNSLMIVLEDFGAESLKSLIGSMEFGLEDALKIAISIVDSLSEIHSADVIHKDVNPSNVVMNPSTRELKIIDFGISAALIKGDTIPVKPDVLEGTLAYMSPEQTGRMNRSIDYRTDYYSLGATLYELFTGSLPFDMHDPLELVHCHIARTPKAPHEIKDKLPTAVSDIVMKLLAKNAEERYQSAQGIRADLEECLRQIRERGHVQSFLLASRDVPERFQIPQKLYGRSQEIEILMAACDRISAGQREMTLVTGQAGIGKTSLVKEIYRPITAQRGYFVSGKFEQFSRNVPYSAIVDAFRELIEQILTESEERLTYWRMKLLETFGPNAQVIVDVIPEIELIVGPQPPPPELGPMESQNRFGLVFQDFVRVFCSPSHPLVVFLDDVQWADSSSLKLLELMMTDQETQYLFVIVAYRDREVDSTHPFVMILEELAKRDVVVNHLHLGELSREHVIEMIADTLHRDTDSITPLADLAQRKTAGNPFFLKQFLRSLHDEKLLRFDFRIGGWEWDLREIQLRQITDNVVELMANKFRGLSSTGQDLLKMAACMGTEFGIQVLSWVVRMPQRDIALALNEALSEGLIFPVGAGYKLLELGVPDSALTAKISYRFAHDRIRDAAYSLIPEDERPKFHLSLGQIMLRETAADLLDLHIYEVVNQFNFATILVTEEVERIRLAELNMRAGKKAKLSAAFEAALHYFKAGLVLLEDESWKKHYDLTLELFLEATQAAYLTTKFEEMERLAETVLNKAQGLLDKVRVYEVQIQASIAHNNRAEAVKKALPILGLLGEKFPENPSRARVLADFAKTRLVLIGHRVEKLANQPEMSDPNKLAAMRILRSVISAAYTAAPNLFALMVFRMVLLSTRKGNSRESAFGYVGYGIILCAIMGDIALGNRFGDLALELVRRTNLREDQARIIFAVHSFLRIWSEPLSFGLTPLHDGFQIGLEVGDVEYAALSGAFSCTQGFAAGKELSELDREMAQYSVAIGKLKQETTKYLTLLYRQAVLNLMGKSQDPLRLTGEAYDDERTLPLLFEANERAIILATFFQKLFLCYLFHDYRQAIEHCKVAEQHLDGAVGTVLVPLTTFYGSLARLAVFEESDPETKRALLKEVVDGQKKLKRWSKNAPSNYLQKFHLVEGDLCRVLNRDQDAVEHYDKAIRLAAENDFIQDEALAYERAGMFYISRKQTVAAKAFLEEARYRYLKWGALAKVKHIEGTYPELLGRTYYPTAPQTLPPIINPQTTPTDTKGILDVVAVLRASQALSGEIVLKDLLKKLMRVVIETAGAEKGVLILGKEGSLFIEAAASVMTGEEFELSAAPVDESQELPLAVVNYVARTKEPVILNDAKAEGSFIHDEYILRRSPRSVFCLPFIRRGRLSGMLYLENNQTAGAFTPKRVEMLQVLSAQAAISIENAKLYRRLEESAIRYRSLFENAVEGIFQTSDEGSFINVNPSFADILGYDSPEEVIPSIRATSKHMYLNPEDRDKWRFLLNSEDQVIGFETQVRRKDGRLIWISMSAHAVRDPEGRISFYEGSIWDITERKQAEFELTAYREQLEQMVAERTEQLRQINAALQGSLEKLQNTQDKLIQSEKMAALGKLVAGVAHEINTPVGVSITAVSLLEEKTRDLSEMYLTGSLKRSDLEQYVEIAQEACGSTMVNLRRAAQLIHSFKMVAVDQSTEEKRRFNVKQYLDELLLSLRPNFKKTRHNISIECPDDLEVNSYPGAFGQILTNLVVNSISHGFEDKEAGNILIEVSRDDDRLCLRYTDDGKGMTAQERKQVFDPFFTTKRAKGGTGLGMHIVYNLVTQKLGGRIDCSSSPGQGTLFVITLPLEE